MSSRTKAVNSTEKHTLFIILAIFRSLGSAHLREYCIRPPNNIRWNRLGIIVHDFQFERDTSQLNDLKKHTTYID